MQVRLPPNFADIRCSRTAAHMRLDANDGVFLSRWAHTRVLFSFLPWVIKALFLVQLRNVIKRVSLSTNVADHKQCWRTEAHRPLNADQCYSFSFSGKKFMELLRFSINEGENAACLETFFKNNSLIGQFVFLLSVLCCSSSTAGFLRNCLCRVL